MKAWQIAAVAVLAVSGAQGAEAPRATCGMPLPALAEPAKADYTPCLRTGAIGIGDALAAIEKALGQPIEPPRDVGDMELRTYAHNPSDGSYITVGIAEGRAVMIQVAGFQPKGKQAFAGIEVGDVMSKVITALGNPAFQRCAPAVQQEIWTYDPFPIVFSIAEGAVTGFRLMAAPGEGPFEPLIRVERMAC